MRKKKFSKNIKFERIHVNFHHFVVFPPYICYLLSFSNLTFKIRQALVELSICIQFMKNENRIFCSNFLTHYFHFRVNKCNSLQFNLSLSVCHVISASRQRRLFVNHFQSVDTSFSEMLSEIVWYNTFSIERVFSTFHSYSSL